MDSAILVPLPAGFEYVMTGKQVEAAQSGRHKQKCTRYGQTFGFAFPLTSRRLLQNAVRAQDQPVLKVTLAQMMKVPTDGLKGKQMKSPGHGDLDGW